MTPQMSTHLQSGFLRLLITDDSFIKLVHGRVDPQLFSSRLTQALSKLCFDYYENHNAAPGDHFHDELTAYLATKPDAEREEYAAFVKRLHEQHPPNREYVLRRVGDFVKGRQREIALVKAAECLAEGHMDEADNVLFNVLQSGIPEEDAGLDYLRDFTNVDHREFGGFLMPTGIRSLDKLIGGYNRGQLVVCLGGPKAGKSWFLAHCAKTAVSRGLNTLHLTFEVSREEQETRYDMMISCRGTSHIGEKRRVMIWNDDTDKPDERNIMIRSVFDAKAVIAARRRLLRLGGSLRIKKYPQGGCSPAEVDRYIEYLEAYEDWSPDVVVLDYPDIMDLSQFGAELRHQLNGVYIWAKGLADRRNVLVFAVSQVRREAMARRWVRAADCAEDIRKAANCDIMLAIGRGPEEVAAGIAGLSVLLNRSGHQDVGCTISMCYDVGQFCLSSWIGKAADDAVMVAFGG